VQNNSEVEEECCNAQLKIFWPEMAWIKNIKPSHITLFRRNKKMCFHICVCKQRQLIDCVYPGASLSFIRFLSQRVGNYPLFSTGLNWNCPGDILFNKSGKQFSINPIQLIQSDRCYTLPIFSCLHVISFNLVSSAASDCPKFLLYFLYGCHNLTFGFWNRRAVWNGDCNYCRLQTWE